MIRTLLVLLALATIAPEALADWQTRSWSRWEIGSAGAEAVVGIEAIELQRLGLPDDAQWLSAELARTVGFRSAGADCPLDAAEPRASPQELRVVRLHFSCGQQVTAPSIRVRLLGDVASQPLHYATVLYSGRSVDALLTQGDDTVEPEGTSGVPGIAPVVREYVALGFAHILEGLDHIAFLLCLLLAASGLARRAWMVTGFTLGHSITLSLSALGFLRVQTAGVEALIGFTVALLAAEVWQRSNGGRTATVLLSAVTGGLLLGGMAVAGVALPPTAAAALLILVPAYLMLAARSSAVQLLHLGMMAVFGLVHGLGFASALRSIGLPEGRRAWALAGFNIGVELGQLVLLGLFATMLALLARVVGARRMEQGEKMLAGLLCATGIFWLVQRAA